MSDNNVGKIVKGVQAIGHVITTILSWNFGNQSPPSKKNRLFCCISGAFCGIYCSYLILLSPLAIWITVQSSWPSLIYYLKLAVSSSPITIISILFLTIPGVLSAVLGLLFGWLVALTSPEESTALTLFLQPLILVVVLFLFFLLILLAVAAILGALFGAKSAFGKIMRYI